jgi:hypothetical protein
MSGDWYILLLMMKYACKGRTGKKDVKLWRRRGALNLPAYSPRERTALACE